MVGMGRTGVDRVWKLAGGAASSGNFAASSILGRVFVLIEERWGGWDGFWHVRVMESSFSSDLGSWLEGEFRTNLPLERQVRGKIFL